jgi:cysteine synthase A
VLRVDLLDEIVWLRTKTLTPPGELAKQEGIVGGISTGAVLWAALASGQTSEFADQLIVAIPPALGSDISAPLYGNYRLTQSHV